VVDSHVANTISKNRCCNDFLDGVGALHSADGMKNLKHIEIHSWVAVQSMRTILHNVRPMGIINWPAAYGSMGCIFSSSGSNPLNHYLGKWGLQRFSIITYAECRTGGRILMLISDG
jgi:hypothetical protein